MRWYATGTRSAWWRALAVTSTLLLAGFVAVAPVSAQDAVQDETAQEGAEGDFPDEFADGEELPDIDQILEEDEEVLGGGGYTYDPGDRRDPFKSLLQARQSDVPQGPRPEGVPGLLIDEIIVSGIFSTSEGWVAQVQVSENDKSYLLRVGDQLYDGDVVSISKNEVVFKQIVRDPTALKPFREVPKKLNP